MRRLPIALLVLTGCPPQQAAAPTTEVVAQDAYRIECPKWDSEISGQVTKVGNVYTFNASPTATIHAEGPCTVYERRK